MIRRSKLEYLPQDYSGSALTLIESLSSLVIMGNNTEFEIQCQCEGSLFHLIAKWYKGQNDSLSQSRRQFHVEPGPREKALLAPDPSLKWFKSHKKGVALVKRLGDVLTIVIVAGACYEIYVRAVMREEARQQAKEQAGASGASA
ncbi:succinate dehydrogenase subunit 7B, mitochondrial-like isoform X3 [Pyrus x bretschneideri]|uniref:succinate dehydrogenase subunit 7B, mitochondrial-like isoform X3 n=1 Tax=Pyrus x bretschneideri TaxID=225117 RepID=UPI00202F26DD|nr:succinate dehydrogenase subunit 7B, mitochondrial-like isoform X3 [Pyrus x bretschneideri]XP_048445841.1 succinate dehydrogenase subunit 7B, mitochondrial-like isoform X3 [Pyrus x bretschneideri]